MEEDLLFRLNAVERLANASKLERFLSRPVSYGFAMVFNKAVYPLTRKGILRKAGTFFGCPMQMLLPAGTDIFLAGGKTHRSEVRLARYMIRTLRPGGAFIDIGAHFGYFSLLASRVMHKGTVWSVEASPANFAILSANIGHVDTIRSVHKAVSDSNEPVAFYEMPVIYSEYNTTEPGQFEQETWFQQLKPEKHLIESTTLDQLVDALDTPDVMIKIDVEGAEARVIRGGQQYLNSHSPVVVMEYLAPRRNNRHHREALQLLTGMHYRAYFIDAEGDLKACPDPDAYLEAEQIDSDNIVFVKTTAAAV